MENKLIYILSIYIEWVYFQQILILWMNYSFNNTLHLEQ